jgi:hypothetical protein
MEEEVQQNIESSELVVKSKKKITKPVDETEAKVKKLREQGFDDNRIAAMLMINKEKVQSIK